MSTLIHIGENLDLAVEPERWLCGKCGHDIGPARDNVKRGLLVGERDPAEIHRPLIKGEYTFSPNPRWIRILEFYCPACGVQLETEYLPPGHPITNTTEIDLDALKARLASGELTVEDGHLRPAGEG
ncbi:MAG: acetone carboxylase subunit gamma [Gammaproteobacteria bacterium]